MNSQPPGSLDVLLERLCGGDDAAAAEAFVDYEPYLRKVVRRMLPAQLRAKFDSADIVQSVYGDVLGAFRAGGMRFSSVVQLRMFLIRATRNRFIDRVRQHRTALRLELPMHGNGALESAPGARDPRPSESASAAELWQRLLAACPVEHHAVLQLRRTGAGTQEIADQLGLHEGSVRRILRNLAARIALEPPLAGGPKRAIS